MTDDLRASREFCSGCAEGERDVTSFRALAKPCADMLRAMRYPEMYPPEEGGDYRPVAASRTMFLDHVTRSDAELIVDRLQRSAGSMAVT